MDRDKVIELLRGGLDGIRKWNEYRVSDGFLRVVLNLSLADLSGAKLRNADLSGADFIGANLYGVDLNGARLSTACFGATSLANVDLSSIHGLEEVRHYGPSSVGVDTLMKSRGQIPTAFLRHCGLSPWQIEVARLHDPNLIDESCRSAGGEAKRFG